MSQSQNFNWKKYLPYIIAGPVGLILLKTFTHTDMYRDYLHKTKVNQLITIESNYHNKQIDFFVKNKSSNTVKNLMIKCDFFSESETMLKQGEYTIYRIFNSKENYSIENFEVTETPNQTKSIKCSLSDFQILTKEMVKELKFKKEALNRGYTNNEIQEYLKLKKLNLK
jgi:hypothetical protein